VWQLSIYAELTVTEESGAPLKKFGIMSGPKRVFEAAERKAKWLTGHGSS